MGSLSGGAKYGLAASQPLTKDVTGAANGAVTQTAMSVKSLENPMLWLIGIGAITLGFVAVSTSARIGPLKVSGSV